MTAGKLEPSDQVTLAQRLLQHRMSSGELMSNHDIVSEHMGHMYVCCSPSTSCSAAFQLTNTQDRWFRHDFYDPVLPLLGTNPPTRHCKEASS